MVRSVVKMCSVESKLRLLSIANQINCSLSQTGYVSPQMNVFSSLAPKTQYICNELNHNEDHIKFEELKCFWPKCNCETNNQFDLDRHIQTHSQEKSFKCDECEKTFLQKNKTNHARL